MFPDFSGLGDGMKSLNEKFDRLIELLEKIESNTRKPNPQAEAQRMGNLSTPADFVEMARRMG